jgi:hypothetical protein
MATFVPVHAAGDGAWSWHLVGEELRRLGHDQVAIDLPDDPASGLEDYADTVADAVGGRDRLVVVAHSFGAFTGPLVCTRLPAEALVLLAPMVPRPGEPPSAWWDATGQGPAQEAAGTAGGDDLETYYHDVPRALADEALRQARDHPSMRAYEEPWPLDAWPDVRTVAAVGRDDRLLPAAWLRGVIRDRLGIEADELPGGHCLTLSRPAELAGWLVRTLDA